MTATKDALNLVRVPRHRIFSIDDVEDFRPLRMLDDDGACRSGVRVATVHGNAVIYDERTRQVFVAHPGEYEPNVQKDADGNPVETK